MWQLLGKCESYHIDVGLSGRCDRCIGSMRFIEDVLDHWGSLKAVRDV